MWTPGVPLFKSLEARHKYCKGMYKTIHQQSRTLQKKHLIYLEIAIKHALQLTNAFK